MVRDVSRRIVHQASGSSIRNIPTQKYANSDVLVGVVWAMLYECTTAAMPASSHQPTETAMARRM
jgi:hypothetical protein